jgi:hypothetical protein
MPRIAPLVFEQTSGDVRAAYERGLARYGRMTNMKRTLLHSLPSYEALMTWYPLFDVIASFLGERLAVVFAHAISSESDCLVCTTYMRRILIDWGERPDALLLDARGDAVVQFGRALVAPGNRVPPSLYDTMAGFFDPGQMVALTSFAGMMIATNIVNNVLEIDLDEYLYAYREQPGARSDATGDPTDGA